MFAPTSKLSKDIYKNKLPCWSDRIIYRSSKTNKNKELIELVNYDSNNLIINENRPVYAQFIINDI